MIKFRQNQKVSHKTNKNIGYIQGTEEDLKGRVFYHILWEISKNWTVEKEKDLILCTTQVIK